MGFRFWGWGLGFRVWGLGFRGRGLWVKGEGFGFRGFLGSEGLCRLQCLGFRSLGFFRIELVIASAIVAALTEILSMTTLGLGY